MQPILTYCTNLLPGESLDEVRAMLRGFASPLRTKLAIQGALPIGLYLSSRACDELEQPGAFDAFEGELKSLNIQVVTINAFPFGGFHDTIVKERVFEPAWDAEPRRVYTEKAARIFARLLPRGSEGSISTHSGYYKESNINEERDWRVARAWLRTAIAFNKIHEETGRKLILSIEPEPMSRIETTDESIQFLELTFMSTMRRMAAEWSVSPSWLEGVARRHLGVCFDCCHQSVEFEDPVASLTKLSAAGIQIGKIQASSAPAVLDPKNNRAALAKLLQFAEPKYLHQTYGRAASNRILKHRDLAPALADETFLTTVDELRTHFHIPIYLATAGHPDIRTTRGDLERVLKNCSELTNCIEIETYTMSATPEPPNDYSGMVEIAAREWKFAEALAGL
ncbi:MAG: metabolite traffic protein EboE [Planctomycetota bacterium]